MLPMTFPHPPGDGVWNLGPLPLRGYALCIILGIVVAIWIGERRWVARGGRPGDVQDLAVWAVPFGVVGARLYHVATDWEKYFGEGRNPVTALYVWRGGLGIWGAVALGALGVWIWSRRRGIRITALMDTLAPAVIVAQAIGRWGNWFNQELFGKPTDLPWALDVTDDIARDNGYAPGTTFHPTFLYECVWNLGVFGLLLWAERRFKLGYGRVFALYVMGYTLGRGWIEYLRVDAVQLDDVLGLRFNVWTSIVLFVAAAAYFVWSSRRHPGREPSVYLPGREPAPEADEAGETTGAGEAAIVEAPEDDDEPADEAESADAESADADGSTRPDRP
ncbi:prolipoprotein diacylglyceryl transferase [Nocardioides dongxiaopingii]|uniref:prolipoprotein diacylglyceryl transferase n=1 Tax=Nocardioides dongxiaopingii TaxID=2576036 RepID=UPI0010C7643F|nr:prolipoprotein diacylglyceryl transferase [Nocardioides dongxiaopingii]